MRNGKKGTATICRNGPKGARGGIRAASKYVDHCLGGTSLIAAKGVAAGETTPFAALRDVPPLLELEFAGPVASAAVETTPFAALQGRATPSGIRVRRPSGFRCRGNHALRCAQGRATPSGIRVRRPSGFRCRGNHALRCAQGSATPSEIRVRRPSGFRCRASRPRPPRATAAAIGGGLVL